MGLAWSAFGEKAEAVVPGFPPHLSKLTPSDTLGSEMLESSRVHTSGFDLPFERCMVQLNAIETRIVEVKANMPRNSNHSSLFHHATS